MVKKLGKLLVVCLIIIGGLNIVSLNARAFKDIKTTVTTKPLSEIPGGVLSTVTHHQWKFVKS
jgi:hypothetical protein